MYILRLVQLAGIDRSGHGQIDPEEKVYVGLYDPDGLEGEGFVELCDSIEDAQKFPTPQAALELWRAQSTIKPLREDGQPNRPLTAFTVEVVPI